MRYIYLLKRPDSFAPYLQTQLFIALVKPGIREIASIQGIRNIR